MNYNYPNIRILMVGVGGIGCEILKIVSKFTFQEFHIIDMDTIEVSNLNRQFLFRLEHRGQSKSLVAAETMKNMAPQLKIIAHFAAINSPGYTMDFFRQFDAVIMALDNAETRSYVNKVCQALGIFIVDAGSMGFKGQANAYYQGTVCYDCYPIATTQKQYPACTIRSQPSNCTHCVIWAKYLFTQLFSGEVGILEVEGFDKSQPNSVFNKFFKGEEMPNSIDIVEHELIKKYHFAERKETLEELQGMWFYAYDELNHLGQLQYDKDDDLHVLFIYASTALRCRNFKIEQYDYQQIKSISGNIIHAIASTNSIVAALEIQRLLSFIENHDKAKYYQDLNAASYVQTGKKERILTLKAAGPNPLCNSCFHNQIYSKVDFQVVKVVDLVNQLKNYLNSEINIVSLSRIIWDDEDEDDNSAIRDKKLNELFKLDLDNRLVIKSIEEKFLAVFWLQHLAGQAEIQFASTKISDKLLKFKNPLQHKKKERVRTQQEIKELKETEVMPIKNPEKFQTAAQKSTEILIDEEPIEQAEQNKKVELVID
ncbi:unnamed protein product (macronuclear) [Paramecium tetraurelia]|uniref:SUMO-activating enzyme subunit n=3 Tax=Paramecium TaxID=5884 RepID=Q2Q4H0_PARTE|nr:uncharacterized protein GSPATT00022332001 [Paramecium tetraurelia]ABB36601.1 ubiquitin-activating enzyme 2 [Paramecium tetraurelia]CAK89162.1 unnamed protein product [Paramecium tetraurelia]|eukprot:XP_001456559.1 hypothetical protein (macronuclear) [Paramecium tetraurelia strain d4-2]